MGTKNNHLVVDNLLLKVHLCLVR